jgi:hypothetical protein
MTPHFRDALREDDMRNETISRILGATLGAALIIAGLAAFGPRNTASTEASIAPSMASLAPAAVLYASETVNVVSGN